MTTVEFNIKRLEYLLASYQMSEREFLSRISQDLKIPLEKEDIWTDNIKINHLKRIDKVFEKGIQYYLNPSVPKITKEGSIFFRKTDLGESLNFESKKIVHQFEESSFSISAIAKIAEIDLERKLPVFDKKHDPKDIGKEIRKELNVKFRKGAKNYLEELIKSLASVNVLVYEFVEHHTKIEKANIEGFFIKPNLIVLKRQQRYFEREIFTLSHELGHYLIKEEAAEEMNFFDVHQQKELSKTEKWCNDFAFYFLLGEMDGEFDSFKYSGNEDLLESELLQEISSRTHLSKTALLTKLFMLNKISCQDYKQATGIIAAAVARKQQEDREKIEMEKEMGIPFYGRSAVPIKSPLMINTYQKALYEGVINEYQFCKGLNIKAEDFSKFAYESSY